MATTREQAEAHAYDNLRQATSLTRGTDEAIRDPRRRLNRALAGGVAIGILVMAGFGVAGWLGGGKGPKLPDGGAVVVSGSGDRYVMSDGVLHPALNLSSALLVGGGKRTEVRSDALSDVRRGLPVGIPAAPDALPDKDDLTTEPWTVCTRPAEAGEASSDTRTYVAVPEAGPSKKRTGQARSATVLAQTGGDTLWLLTESRRYRVSESIRGALGLQRTEPVKLTDDILATIPEGPAIETPKPPRKDGDRPDADLPFKARVGELASSDIDGVNPQYFQVRSDGLAAVSELVYTLLRTTDTEEHRLTPADAAKAPRSAQRAPGDPAWPEGLPSAQERDRGQPLCVTTPPGSTPGDTPWQATVHLPRKMPQPKDVTPVSASEGKSSGTADAVYVPPGKGALVRATASAGSGGTYTLVTDSGTAYPVPSKDAVKRLAYQAKDAPSLPKGFVAMLPTGPVLDPRAAAEEHRGERQPSDTPSEKERDGEQDKRRDRDGSEKDQSDEGKEKDR